MSKSFVKAIEILDCFITNPEMTINELAETANMPKTTVFRLASSLEEAGLLVKKRKSSHEVTYRMGLKLLIYGKHVSQHMEYNKIALPHMKRLNKEIDELVHVTIIEGNEAVYVETVDSSKPVRLVVKIGARAPLYAGSAPKLLLSGLSNDEVDEYLKNVELKKLTKNTLDNSERIKEEIEKIRENGYSISYSENFKDTVGFSYPIYDHEGNMVAAIGVSIPDIDHTKEREDFLLVSLEKTVKKIWEETGYIQT
ncbi:IclR family transcriptional regulator [Salicibibacter cibarius]|uniref:IclR family transcriptional regulator n=1 Tax=Salicibibacter cibarius TaxID=2743000 RepID=A0A7T6Z6K2_9BACI|nr:IclR family transcriptional regulator [Salicibibacter cibarius]QQK77752.1 IclR family transcriptional regulator [Salicibibacter cibarius]